MRAHAAAMLRCQFLRGVLEHAAAPPGEPQVGAEREIAGGDFAAEPRAAAGDENALTFEQAFLEHGALHAGERLF